MHWASAHSSSAPRAPVTYKYSIKSGDPLFKRDPVAAITWAHLFATYNTLTFQKMFEDGVEYHQAGDYNCLFVNSTGKSINNGVHALNNLSGIFIPRRL